MAHVQLRPYSVGGAPTFSLTAQTPSDPEVRPALAVLASAITTPRPNGQWADIPTALSEAAVLIAQMDTAPGVPLAWRSHRLSTPPHFQRFLTESAALAITIEAATRYGWNPSAGHSIWWADDFKRTAAPRLHGLVPGGTRPDVLFQTPAGWRGLESRGRSEPPPKRGVTQKQRDRLEDLNDWAVNVQRVFGSLPAWGMVWCWFDLSATQVDFFDPGEPLQLSVEEISAIAELRSQLERDFSEQLASHPESFAVQGTPIRMQARPISLTDAGSSLSYVAIGASTGQIRVREDIQNTGENVPGIDVVPYGSLLFAVGTTTTEGPGTLADKISAQVRGALENEPTATSG